MICLKNGRITADFNEPRPLSAPADKRDHIHGALDIAGGDGVIVAPARGTAQGFVLFRGVEPQKGKRAWADASHEKSEIYEFPWREYWQDIFGGFIVLIEPNGRLHILCHIWPSQLLNPQISPIKFPFRFAYYIEERAQTRWPCHILMTETAQVSEGQPLARVGNAGYSTGPHVHWEIHREATKLDDYPNRINPREYL